MPKCSFYDQDMLQLLLKIVMQLDMDFSRNHFNYYTQNCEFVIINMTMITTINNYDYIYDYTTNVMILK